MKHSIIKNNIQKSLFNKLKKINGIISVTLVGSFVNKNNLSGISDIDTVVICKSLNYKKFLQCQESVKEINLEKCGLPDHRLKINNTFGPLKFDEKKIVVIHLMIYDIVRHYDHVTFSPFTCFDWERSKTKMGLSLKEIYPVGTLQFRDFIEVRRGINNYIKDLEKKVVSYREYTFNSGKIKQRKKFKSLDNRHVGEFCYHIFRNLTSNYLKLINRNNLYYKDEDITKEIKRLLHRDTSYMKNFKTICSIKSERSDHFPKGTLNVAKRFIADFEGEISLEWNKAIPVYFFRHFKTRLNDGTFLGQKRNPGVILSEQQSIENYSIESIYSSPMKRCIETSKIIWGDLVPIIDERLLEINYGDAEGLTYKQLVELYPEMISMWDKGLDPSFPNGENTKDIDVRLDSFLNHLKVDISNKNRTSIGVVTHNGILRCLIGKSFSLNQKEWFKLKIPHNTALEFLYFKNHFYPNIHRNLISKIFSKIGWFKI